MTWEFEIIGDPWVLEQLSHALQSDDIKVLKENNTFRMGGRIFDGISRPDEARKAAEDQLSKISGLAIINLQLKAPLQIKSVASREGAADHKTFYVSLSAGTIQTHVSMLVTDAQGNILSRSPSPESIRASLNIAGLDKSMDKVLRLLGSGDLSWVNLYRLYEIVRDDIGGEKAIVSRGWCQADDLRLFRWTANHPEASGDDARHGSLSQSAPKKPMELTQAQILIQTMGQKWLQSKNLSASNAYRRTL